MLTQDIKLKLSKMWDMLWAGGLTNPITSIEQISYLLFMRRIEYVDNGSYFIGNEDYKWSVYKDYEPLELLNHIRNNVFPFIKSIQDRHQPFSQAMADAVFSIDKPRLLKETVEIIDSIYIDIEKQQKAGQHFQDTQGDLYEYLLKETSEAGKNGQFRTPRHIIQLMCELVDPNIGDKVCDLTCGTGGFLIGAYHHILTKHSKDSHKIKDENGLYRSVEGSLLTQKQAKQLSANTFFGFDIDSTMIRISLMNLIMHGILEPKIVKIDTLSSDFDKYEANLERENSNISSGSKFDGYYNCILANPPFTGRIDRGSLSETFDSLKTNSSEVLFINRIIQMLAINGKCAVIVPEGVLSGSSKAQKQTRIKLLKDCSLEAVISLPSGAFFPYTGVKTSILIFKKVQTNSQLYHTSNVWFYDMKSDGYSLDTNRKKLKDNPLPILIESYKAREADEYASKESKSFYVSIDNIEENDFVLNIGQYKEIVYEPEHHEVPHELLSKILELENKITEELQSLKSLIN
jgi:type I restriction enzyme M protein